MLINTEPAYILHKRPYRETSQILDVFTRNHGRLSLLSRGSRGVKSKQKGVLQLFRPLLLSWRERGELPTLGNVDVAERTLPHLTGKSLFSAMYMNELLVYLLHKNDIHKNIFDDYHTRLYALCDKSMLENTLRIFERDLLSELGFGLNLECDADSGEPIKNSDTYHYYVEHGPVKNKVESTNLNTLHIMGESLIALREGLMQTNQHRAEIKTMMRAVLDHHMGSKKLRSRLLFRKASRISF